MYKYIIFRPMVSRCLQPYFLMASAISKLDCRKYGSCYFSFLSGGNCSCILNKACHLQTVSLLIILTIPTLAIILHAIVQHPPHVQADSAFSSLSIQINIQILTNTVTPNTSTVSCCFQYQCIVELKNYVHQHLIPCHHKAQIYPELHRLHNIIYFFW